MSSVNVHNPIRFLWLEHFLWPLHPNISGSSNGSMHPIFSWALSGNTLEKDIYRFFDPTSVAAWSLPYFENRRHYQFLAISSFLIVEYYSDGSWILLNRSSPPELCMLCSLGRNENLAPISVHHFYCSWIFWTNFYSRRCSLSFLTFFGYSSHLFRSIN